MDKLNEMGYRAFAISLAVAVFWLLVFGIAMKPLVQMSPSGVPMAIVNLDKGADLPNGEHVVAGDLVEERIQEAINESADGDVAPIKFVSLLNRAELDENITDYYGAIVIPVDFTEKQMAGTMALSTTLGQGLQDVMTAQQQSAAQPSSDAMVAMGTDPATLAEMQQQAQAKMAEQVQGIIQDALAAQQEAEKPSIELVINMAKSPIFANSMQASMTSVLAASGIDVTITTIGEVGENAKLLSGFMGVQMTVMPLTILSLIMSLIGFAVARGQDTERTRASKARMTGILVCYACVAALVAALAAYGIVVWFGGMVMPAQAILLLWFASFCLMLVNLGLMSISIPIGVILMFCVFAFGMGTAIVPPEMLPVFWADWVYPWAPQVAIGDGMRNIIYLGAGAFDAGMPRLITYGCVGLALLAIGIFISTRKAEK